MSVTSRTLDAISNSTNPEEFYVKYVATRTPVIIEGHLNDAHWKASKLWTDNNYLRSKAGDKNVQVEEKTKTDLSFGKGSVKHTTFSDFLTDLENHNNSVSDMYMSTQELHYSEDGKPDLVSEPVASLISDIPVTPSLMGNLVPQNVNLWMGASAQEISSGLHHDYHDNLYILLRGKKKFLLIPPACALDMYTVGVIDKVHANGRINYANQLPTLADGSALTSHVAVKASTSIDEAAARLDHILQTKEQQDTEIDEESSDICEAEKALDQAMEDLLDAEIAFDDNSNEDEDEDDYGEDDGDDCFDEEGDNDEDEDEDEDEDDDLIHDEQLENILTAAKLTLKKTEETIPEAKRKQGAAITSSTEPEKKKSKVTNSSSPPVASVKAYPDNFSQVREMEQSEKYINTHFPKYYAAKSTHGIQVELHANQMLYLPAGWFHEVFSVGAMSSEKSSVAANSTVSTSNTKTIESTASKSSNSEDSSNSSSGADNGSSIHMALNYWFHPPDGHSFDKPYSSDFWPEDWKSRNYKLI